MAEILFFATENDHELVLSKLVNEFGATFVLASGDCTPLPIFSKVEDVISVVLEGRYGARFYALSPLWQVESMVVSQVQGRNGAPRFYLRGRDGGPSIDYIARTQEHNETGSQIVASSLGTFASYYLTSGEMRRPTKIENAFSEIKKLIDRSGKRTVSSHNGKQGPMAMDGALKAYNQGVWLRSGDWTHLPKGGI